MISGEFASIFIRSASIWALNVTTVSCMFENVRRGFKFNAHYTAEETTAVLEVVLFRMRDFISQAATRATVRVFLLLKHQLSEEPESLLSALLEELDTMTKCPSRCSTISAASSYQPDSATGSRDRHIILNCERQAGLVTQCIAEKCICSVPKKYLKKSKIGRIMRIGRSSGVTMRWEYVEDDEKIPFLPSSISESYKNLTNANTSKGGALKAGFRKWSVGEQGFLLACLATSTKLRLIRLRGLRRVSESKVLELSFFL